jgi:hypothetical protein
MCIAAVACWGDAMPRVMNVDKNPAYPTAVEALKAEGTIPRLVALHQCKYLKNVIEQDHRTVKKRVWLAKGYGSFQSAWRTLRGIETVHVIRKGRVRWLAKGDAVGQAHFIAELFGLTARPDSTIDNLYCPEWSSGREILVTARWGKNSPCGGKVIMLLCLDNPIRRLSQPNRNVLFLAGYQGCVGPRLPSIPIMQNGARRQGIASPRNNRAPLTAPLRSEHLLRRGKGEVRKSGPVGHFYLAGIGHFYLAATNPIRRLDTVFLQQYTLVRWNSAQRRTRRLC